MWTNTCCSHPLVMGDEMKEENAWGVRLAAQRKVNSELGQHNYIIQRILLLLINAVCFCFFCAFCFCQLAYLVSVFFWCIFSIIQFNLFILFIAFCFCNIANLFLLFSAFHFLIYSCLLFTLICLKDPGVYWFICKNVLGIEMNTQRFKTIVIRVFWIQLKKNYFSTPRTNT